MDKAVGQRGGRGVHQVDFAVSEVVAGSGAGGLEFHTLNLAKASEAVGGDDDLGVAVVVVAVAGEVAGSAGGTVGIGKRHGAVGTAQDRIGLGGEVYIDDAGSIGGRAVGLDTYVVMGVASEASEGIGVGGDAGGYDGGVVIDSVGGIAVVVSPTDGGTAVGIIVNSHSGSKAAGAGSVHGIEHSAG